MFFSLNKNLYAYLISALSPGRTAASFLLVGFIILSIALPYMLGSINFGIIISKRKYRGDIREHGSGNAGATNMLRTYGRGAAALTMAGDMLKCAVGVAIGGGLIGLEGASVAGLFCVMGHVFPCWHRFKGGKGVAATAVVALMLDPLTFAVLLLVFLAIVLTTKYVSLASIMSAMLFPIFLNTLSGGGPHVLTAFAVAAVVVFMHRGNIKRLLDKTEPKIELGRKKKKDVGGEDAPVGDPAEKEAGDSAAPKRRITKNTSKKKLNRRK